MFEDLIESLSTNTNLEDISIKGTSWEKQGKGEQLVKTLRRTRMEQEPQLLALLADLESESQQLPSGDVWGSYFNCNCQDGLDCEHRGEWRWEVRLRLLTAIGKCSTLKRIQLNPLGKCTARSVRQEEALALLSSLQYNLVLQELCFTNYKGFVRTAACRQALTAVIQSPWSSLELLGLNYMGLSAQGLGDIASALGRNGISTLDLCGNQIGNAFGAQQLAHILTDSPTLRNLWIGEIGMDEEGAMLIADALAHTTTLTQLRIGDEVIRNPKQVAPMFITSLLQALVWPESNSSHSTADKLSDTPTPRLRPAAFNRSITLLIVNCPGGQEAVEPGLGEALAGVLRSNRALKELQISSFVVTRGLEALRQNSSITNLRVYHHLNSYDTDMDPMLLTILEECKSVKGLGLRIRKPFSPCGFTKEFFQGLKNNNLSLKKLVLDGWDGLDDHMFQHLIHSLSTNTKLDHISIKGTSWERQGKGEQLVKALRETKVVEPQLLALLADLESKSPSLQQLPSSDLWRRYFDRHCFCQDGPNCEHRGEWQWEVRLRLFTAIGNCPTLRKLDLNLQWLTSCSVRQHEALVLLSGLQHNAVLQQLSLCGCKGFVTTPACVQALSAVIQTSYRSLKVLDLRHVGLSAEGLGGIAAALRRNGTSSSGLASLLLSGNHIGNGVGAQHLADILTISPTLRPLWIVSIGMDGEGAVVIADALAHSSTLTALSIGDEVVGNPKQAAPNGMFIIPLLQALVWPRESSHSPSSSAGPIHHKERGLMMRWKDLGYRFLSGLNDKWSGGSMKDDFADTAAIPLLQPFLGAIPLHPDPAVAQNPPPPHRAFNRSIRMLVLRCPGGQQAVEPELGEALGCVLRSNRALNQLTLASSFINRGLEALSENSGITNLTVFHSKHSDDDDMDPMLIGILQECNGVQQLQLQFEKPVGPCAFTKAFFQGLHNNRSIKRLVLDGWDGLDDHMFYDLMGSLGPDSNNVLDNISVKETSWEREGMGRVTDISLALQRNKRNSRVQKMKSYLRPWPLR